MARNERELVRGRSGYSAQEERGDVIESELSELKTENSCELDESSIKNKQRFLFLYPRDSLNSLSLERSIA